VPQMSHPGFDGDFGRPGFSGVAFLESSGVHSSPFPTMMFVLAKRISDVEPFATWLQQGDYASEWSGGTSPRRGRPGNSITARLPTPVQSAIAAPGLFGRILGRWSGPNHFRRVRIVDVANGSISRRYLEARRL
jgi:hypothetical protein